MNSKICHDTYQSTFKNTSTFALHRRAYHILHCKRAIFPNFEPSLLIQKSFFDQRKDEFENLSRYTCWHTRVLSKTPAPVALHRRAYHILHCKGAIFPNFEPSLLIQKSFFDQRKDEFENLSRYTCWHTRVLSKTPAPVALHRRAYHILHCKVRFSRILSHPF